MFCYLSCIILEHDLLLNNCLFLKACISFRRCSNKGFPQEKGTIKDSGIYMWIWGFAYVSAIWFGKQCSTNIKYLLMLFSLIIHKTVSLNSLWKTLLINISPSNTICTFVYRHDFNRKEKGTNSFNRILQYGNKLHQSEPLSRHTNI